MMSDKDLYFESLAEIKQLPLFLSDTTDQLSQEIQANCVYLSVPGSLQIEVPELLAFLQEVKHDRQLQLQSSGLKINLLYYIWHDEIAGQLRFNFINSLHQKLPFGCNISLVDNEMEIITDFLHSNYLQGIVWQELIAVDAGLAFETADATVAAFSCKVYQEQISYNSTTLSRSC